MPPILCFPNRTLERFLVRISHDRFPAINVGEQVAVGISSPAMRDQHDPFSDALVHAGLHFYPPTIAFHQNRITVLDAVPFGRFRTDFGQRVGGKLLKGFDLVVLAVGIVKVAVAY